MPQRLVLTLLASLSLARAGELHEAARACKVDRMRQILQQHPALNEADADGLTALHIAIDSRHVVCAGLLLEAGADRTVREGNDRAAIRMLLNSNFGQKAKGPRPGSLEYWVLRGQGDAVKMMLSLGADPNAPGTTGTTPLADAALKGDIEVVRALLARGARPNAVSPAGTQPIHDAGLGGRAEVIRELVKHEADGEAQCGGGAGSGFGE